VFPDQRALILRGMNPGRLNEAIPTFEVDSRLIPGGRPNPFGSRSNASYYQMQLTVRYAF